MLIMGDHYHKEMNSEGRCYWNSWALIPYKRLPCLYQSIYNLTQRSTPRYARRYAASNDSPFYSTRFLRLGGRAPTRREEALSSSAFHSALCASLHSSEWQSLLLYALFEIGRARSEYQWIAKICKKKENLGVPNGAWKSSLLDDLSP